MTQMAVGVADSVTEICEIKRAATKVTARLECRERFAVRSLNHVGTPPCDRAGMKTGAGNGIRTRDPDLGKVVLYH
jgi:hypothetical protein